MAVTARCKWCLQEFDVPERDDGQVHMEDVRALTEAHYSELIHAEMFLFCTACWLAPEGHRPCYDVDCHCECSIQEA